MTKVRWQTIVWCSLVLVGSRGVSAQEDVFFTDLKRGFQENMRGLQGSEFLLEWSSRERISEEWNKYCEEIVNGWEAIDAELSDGAALEMSARMRAGYLSREDGESKSFDRGQLFISANGFRLRRWSGDAPLTWGIGRPLPEDFPHDVTDLIFPREGQFFGILAYDSRLSQSHMSILPIHDVSKYVRGIPLPFTIPALEESTLGDQVATPFDVLFRRKDGIVDSHPDARITLSGETAIVVQVRIPSAVGEGNQAYSEGYLLEAVVDMARGYWPVSIKTSPIGLFEGRLVDQFARSCWLNEIDVELTQTAEGYWFPHRIVVATNAMASDHAALLSIIQNPFTFRRLALGTPVEERGVLISGALTKAYSISVLGITPEYDADPFSLEETPGLARYYDSRTGDVRINSEIQESLEIALGQVPGQASIVDLPRDTETPPGPNSLWARWGWLILAVALSAIVVGLFAIVRGHGKARRRLPVD